jgi:2-pyrone-4,6-dicarboxylate lactonase
LIVASPLPVRTYLEEPSLPTLQLPAFSCDSHVHVFGPVSRFAFAAERKITPLDAPKEKLFALHEKLGVARCVIVQSVVHGFDNSVVEDAIYAGGGNYLGVALVRADVSDVELQRLAHAGFRGVRFHFMKHISGGTSVHDVIALTSRLAAVGMHLQVHFESALVHELIPELAKSQVPVVIDHMGRVDARLGPDHADFQALLSAMELPNFHVKVSGIDRIDAQALPHERYTAGILLARLLVERFPERCVWGTDWPHPNHTHIPDDGVLVDSLSSIAPTQALLEQVLVHNPQRLYGFTNDSVNAASISVSAGMVGAPRSREPRRLCDFDTAALAQVRFE